MSEFDDSPVQVDHPLVHAPGVFFELEESEYHRALALSATGVKWVRVSALDWWARSPLNPDPDDEEDSEAMIVGSAYHKRILEGREAFYARYAPSLDPRDFPDALKTNEEIAEAIKRAGGPIKGIKGLRKAELTALLAEYDPQAQVWEALTRDHATEHTGKEFLSAKLIRKIETSAKMIEAHPELGKAFRGGAPEVSCFWADPATGVPCKCRWDYLKQHVIVDLKTAQNVYGTPIDRAVARAIANGRLHIQAGFYLEGARRARQMIRNGQIFGKHDPDFVKAFAAEKSDPVWMWLFQMKGPAPVARGYVLPPGITMDLARYEIEEAKITWARSWKTFRELPWIDQSDIHTIDSTELPSYIAE
jgi:PDDEXK-like uncharacterized protein DUF3799